MNFKKPGFRLGAAAIAILLALGVLFVTNGQYSEVDKKGIITVEDNRRLETVIAEYYIRADPNNKGILKIYNIKKYGSDYLTLTGKYRGEGEDGSVLFLIDSKFDIMAMAPGNMPLSPCFSANVVKDQGKSIVYGNFKNKKWDPKTDLVSDVQIDSIKIVFEDGTVIKEPVSMDKGYIIDVDTLSKIKDIDVYNSKGELQSDLLNESYCTEFVFRKVERETIFQVDGSGGSNAIFQIDENEGSNAILQIDENESSNAVAVFDKSKIQEYWLETVVINNSPMKDGPGNNYKTVGNLKYGDIVYTSEKYNDWIMCISNNGDKKEFWVNSTNLIDEQYHKDYNLGIITAKAVTVGKETVYSGNLVQVLKKDENKSCVTIRVIDLNVGKTGWINNSDYIMAKPGVYFNQAYIRKGTTIYESPSTEKTLATTLDYAVDDMFVNINKEQDGWVSISSYGPIDGWVKKENVFIPMPSTISDEK